MKYDLYLFDIFCMVFFRSPENCNSQIQICDHPEQMQQNNSFQAPYEQRSNCAQPQVLFYHDTEIPSDGNCFFRSIIKIMNLSMSPLQIRRQLLASPFVNSCINPDGARTILSSETEYAEMDCIDIFAKLYNQNVCVHNHYVNTTTKREERQFLHFRVNDSQSFLHLHLRDVHFTPFIEVEEMNANNRTDTQHIENMCFEKSTDVQLHAHDYDEDNADNNDEDDADNYNEDHAANATSDIGINDINVTIPIYTNYYEHANGHLQFYNTFKKNASGHCCAVCDRLWWEKDLKNTTHVHDDILQVILTVIELLLLFVLLYITNMQLYLFTIFFLLKIFYFSELRMRYCCYSMLYV